MRVLRITPLWDWRALDPSPVLEDPRDSMGGHAAQALRTTLATAAAGVEQLVLAAATPGAPREARVADGASIRGVGPAGVPGVHRRNAAWLAGVLAALPGRRREGWDLVHVHASGIVEPLWAAQAARRALGRPLVVTLHHSAQVTYVAQSRRDAAVQVVTRAAERAVVRRAARTLTLTDRLAARLAGGGRTLAVPDSVDAAAFAREPRAAAGAALLAGLGVPAGAPVALYAGRVSFEKGWRDMVALAAAVDGLHVVVAGDGPEMGELRACGHERVHVAGALGHEDVAAAMAAASVLVLPSRFEELGSVLVEAMAAGLPSVAYDVGGVAEAVVPGTTGTLVPAEDVGALTAAVAATLADEGLRERARAEGPRIAAERFDQAAIGARLAALYAEIVAVKA
jgi:glycogen(starch) synthase